MPKSRALTHRRRVACYGVACLAIILLIPHLGVPLQDRVNRAIGVGDTSRSVSGYCHPVAAFEFAFDVLMPGNKQTLLTGTAARQYITGYNGTPPPSEYEGDSVLLVTTRFGKVFMVPAVNGVGCRRVSVPAKLHRILMQRVRKVKAQET